MQTEVHRLRFAGGSSGVAKRSGPLKGQVLAPTIAILPNAIKKNLAVNGYLCGIFSQLSRVHSWK
jgi:hypothetical protein